MLAEIGKSSETFDLFLLSLFEIQYLFDFQ